jgi:hypothetical protein
MIGGLAIFAMIRIFGISMLGLPHQPSMEKRKEKDDYLMIMPILILSLGVVMLGFFAKSFIADIAIHLQAFSSLSESVLVVPMKISSIMLGGSIMIFAVCIYIFQKSICKTNKERAYHTWDCGQPIDVTMQYSATAFSAPIRFFFLTFIGRNKIMESKPVLESNPWIRRYNFSLSIRSNWSTALYAPIAKGFYSLAERIRIIQSGRIQYYVLFLLLALIITLMFAL